jgi:copper homeostasis protein
VPTAYLLEISVETVEGALAAERGGAHRVELCADLRAGGLTPTEEVMRSAREACRLPIFAMIRPRGGDFVYSDLEFERMHFEIETAKRTGMHGVVFGLLKKDRSVDVERTAELVELARPLQVTFHRAFDECADLVKSLEEVITTGADRILTSGGAATAAEGADMLAKLVGASRGRIVILPGGGINAGNIQGFAKRSGAREVHSGLGSVLAYGQGDYESFENEVRKLAGQLANQPG